MVRPSPARRVKAGSQYDAMLTQRAQRDAGIDYSCVSVRVALRRVTLALRHIVNRPLGQAARRSRAKSTGSRPRTYVRTSTCLYLPTSLSAVAVSFDSLRQLLCLSTLVVAVWVLQIINAPPLREPWNHRRERLLQRRRERERDRRDSETAVQREERLSKRRMRDRARRVAHTVERRQSLLQQRRDRLATESAEEREARLQQKRDRLATESAEEREARLQQMRD